MDKKNLFINTNDKNVANKMIANKFKLISATAGIYTFINKPPKNFSFDAEERKKIHYTNILCV